MKPPASLSRIFTLAALALSAYGLSFGNAYATEKGGERLQRLTSIPTARTLEKASASDGLVMACSNCKTVMTRAVIRSKGRAIPTQTAKHLCAGCNSTIEAVGHGKAKMEVIKHVCSEHRNASISCCATTTRATPTEGMAK